jgi:cytochrome c-type biogenesis protein CcmE
MPSKAIRVLMTVAIIGGTLGFFMYTSLSVEAQYFKQVDEISTKPEAWYGRKMNLHGFVVDGSIYTNSLTLEYRFVVENNGQKINVRYKGVVPDTFKSGSEVVLKGQLDAQGFNVDKDGVVAKCPSKYDEAKAAAAGAKRPAGARD